MAFVDHQPKCAVASIDDVTVILADVTDAYSQTFSLVSSEVPVPVRFIFLHLKVVTVPVQAKTKKKLQKFTEIYPLLAF
jgi:hypothetical protein